MELLAILGTLCTTSVHQSLINIGEYSNEPEYSKPTTGLGLDPILSSRETPRYALSAKFVLP